MNMVTSSTSRLMPTVVHRSERDFPVDWGALPAAGVVGVVLRAGRGTRQDRHWVEHVDEARAVGLAVGSYWYVYPSRAEPGRQAELWHRAVQCASAEPF